MINTYRYGGTGKVDREGKESIIQIPPSVVLNQVSVFDNKTKPVIFNFLVDFNY